MKPPSAQDFAELAAPGHNPLRIGVDVLERIMEEDLAAGADVKHAVLRTGPEDRAEKLELLGARFVAEFLELAAEVGIAHGHLWYKHPPGITRSRHVLL